MKKLSFLVILTVFCSFAQAQEGFVVSGNKDFSAGQLLADPSVALGVGSVSPGLQNANVITVDLEDDGCEGYAYTENGFNLPATDHAVDTVLVNYDPDMRSHLRYDSITTLSLHIHMTKHATDTTVFLADYDDPRFGIASGHQDVTYTSAEFGCDSVVDLLVYRMSAIPDVEETALPGQYTVEVTVNTPAFEPADFYAAGGTLTPSSDVSYTKNYPTGETTPVEWTATIADSSANFTQQVKINEPDCSVFHPEDGSGNTYEAVRLIHDCWLKTNLQSLLYADRTTIPDVYQYPNTDPAIYGLLYTYDAATGHYPLRGTDTLQGVCPEGWHLPSYAKVTELIQHYDAEELMSQTNWLNPGSNSTGFTMQPGGYYTSVGHAPYQELLVSGFFWTYTPGSTIYHACEFGSACSTIELIPASSTMGYSVRCLKD